jgi:hypothetical protein
MKTKWLLLTIASMVMVGATTTCLMVRKMILNDQAERVERDRSFFGPGAPVKSYAIVTNSAAEPVTSTGGFVDVTLDTNTMLTGSGVSHSTSSNTQNVTINTAGTYQIFFQLTQTVGDKFKARLFMNGTTQIPGAIVDNYTNLFSTDFTGSSWPYSGPSVFTATQSVFYTFSASDVFKLQVFNPSGNSGFFQNVSITVVGPL